MAAPKDFIKEGIKLTQKANKQLEDLEETLRSLQKHTNGGVWYFSGMLMNAYNIKFNEDVENSYSSMKDNITGNYLYYIRQCKSSQKQITGDFADILRTKLKK